MTQTAGSYQARVLELISDVDLDQLQTALRRNKPAGEGRTVAPSPPAQPAE